MFFELEQVEQLNKNFPIYATRVCTGYNLPSGRENLSYRKNLFTCSNILLFPVMVRV